MPYCALITGLTKRQPSVVSWISAPRWKASCALPMTNGARDGKFRLAAANGARGIADGIEAGGAKPIDGDAGDAVGQAREQERHARHVAIVFARLIGAAEHDLVERRPVELGMARNERPDRNGGEIVGAYLGERAAIAPDRGSHRITEKDVAGFGHVKLVSLVPTFTPRRRVRARCARAAPATRPIPARSARASRSHRRR